MFRESEGCIVPLKRDVQSRGVKPGNAGAGKAAEPSRDSDPTPTALSGGLSVQNRLDHIFAWARESSAAIRAANADGSPAVRSRRSRRSEPVVCVRTGDGGEPDALTAHVRFWEGAVPIDDG